MLRLLTVFFIALLAAGCATNHVVQQPPLQTKFIKSEYLIGVGDQLSINVWRNPELSITVPVRPDGRVSSPLVGDVEAAGKTALELASSLQEKLQAYIRNPEVTVIIVGPRSTEYLDRIRVVGAVKGPVSRPYREGMTVLDMVLEAGGLNDFAAANKAILYRTLINGEQKQYPIYLEDILEQGKLDSNYRLQPLDVISIPERLF